jgi:fluoroacetyl-CoA thioesterase
MTEDLPEPGITAERTFEIERRHTTNLFGEQETPPGAPAATDATPEESIRVLGTPQLLAEVEFLGRQSLRGTLPDGSGVVGIDADVTHLSAIPVEKAVHVRTELTDVTDRTLTIEGTLSSADTDEPIGEVTNRLRVVRRESFRERIGL